jgi:hypothetical protein
MKKEDIHLGEWTRVLFGEAPPLFYRGLHSDTDYLCFFTFCTALAG